MPFSLKPQVQQPDGQSDGQHVVSVVLATGKRQQIVSLSVAASSTVRQIVSQALSEGLDDQGLELATLAIGIFGQRVPDTATTQAGDRVELYRPLPLSPMELRRLRAAERST